MTVLTEWDEPGDEIIDESPEYSPKSEFSKAKQVDSAVTKVIEARAKEMRAGYWNLEVKNGYPIKQWIPDTRKSYISSVSALRALLSPEIMRDSKYLEKEKKCKEKMNELFEMFSYNEKMLEMRTDGRTIGGIPVYTPTNTKIMPEIGATVILQNELQRKIAQGVPGGWDEKVNSYWDNLVLVYDEIFSELNHVIDRLNYFKQAITYG